MANDSEPATPPNTDGDAVRSVVFHDDYELSILLEADGRLRDVLHAVGVDGVEHFARGSATVVSNARHGDGGAQRADEWAERLHVLRTTLRPVHYRTTPPGASPGQPATVECIATPIPTADGQLDSILLQAYDRTSTERVQGRLRESEARFRLLTETVPQMVWQSDAAGNVVYFAPQWEAFTGRTEAELLDGGFIELVHPLDVPTLRASQISALELNAVAFRMRRHDGEYRWLEAEYRGRFDETGAAAGSIGATSDVTDRRAEEAARLRWQKREAIGELAGGVAHDFNNVISAILSNAMLAKQELALDLSPETSLDEIARGAERAAEIVRRLLAFSREDADGAAPASAPFDAGTVVREACALVAATLPAGATLRQFVADDLPPVLGSAADLHRVVVNLLTNAGHAVEGGGDISVTVDAVDKAAAGRAVVGRSVRIRVDDGGTGIPPRLLARIFEPFFTTKASGKGTGLGLAAVQTIVRAHGGTIEAENLDPAGARFTVLLPGHVAEPDPVVGAPGPGVAEEASAMAAAPTAPRVVFVDDETQLARLAARALPSLGFAVRIFTDPTEALEELRTDPAAVDVLVTDLSMPGLSGLELIEQVRLARPDLPVVLSSGYLNAANRQTAERLGVDAILPKPCSTNDLAAELRELVGRDRATGAAQG